MRIASNIAALKANSTVKKNNKKRSETMEELSSGKRINKAADDAAGLAISKNMSSQSQGVNQAGKNVQDGISLLQTAEGGLKNIHKSLQRMRELAVQASNDTYTDADRQEMQAEFEQQKNNINEIANNTEFNNINLLNRKELDSESDKNLEKWDIDWQNTYNEGIGKSIEKTEDGGYIFGARMDPNTSSSYDKVFKLDAEGNTVWEKTYEDYLGTGGGLDLKQTKDGGYIYVSHTYDSDDAYHDEDTGEVKPNIAVKKLDSNGNIEWEEYYGGDSYDRGFSIEQTEDGGYIVGGSHDKDDGTGTHYQAIKLDENGNIEWENTYNGTNGNIESIKQTNDGNYIFTGNTKITKLDSNGDIIWDNNSGSNLYDIQETEDGYIATGDNHEVDSDVKVIKIDENGNIEWENTYGGSDLDTSKNIEQTEEGNYIVTGWTRSNDGDISESQGEEDIWVVELDKEGDLIEEKTYGGSGSERSEDIELTEDGGYVLTGITDSTDGNVEEKESGDDSVWTFKVAGENTSKKGETDPHDIILQVGPNSKENYKIKLTDVTTEGLDIANTSITTREGAQETLSSIDEAIGEVSSERSRFGADQNALEHVENNLTSYEENIESSKSRIEDADMAKQFMKKTKQDILSEAGMAFLAQVNMMPQGILEILG